MKRCQLFKRVGLPETDPALLKLRAAQLRARQMVEAAPEVNRQYISLIDELEHSKQHELRYWLCIQLAMQWRKSRRPKSD